MRIRAILICIGLCTAVGAVCGAADEKEPQHDRYLLLDSRIIESTQNAKLTLGKIKKHPSNPLFGEDKPWEIKFANLYPNVIYDSQDKIYKCWYNPFIVDKSAKGMTWEERENTTYTHPGPTREMCVCYAFSKDGIRWEKLELGLIEYGGDRKNNVVFRGPLGAGVFKDPGTSDEARRYKMMMLAWQLTGTVAKRRHAAVAFSRDGILWSQMYFCPEINPVEVDGLFHPMWVPELKQYVAFARMRDRSRVLPERYFGKKGAVRQIGRTTSPDFLNWTKSEVVFEGEEDHLQLYSMPVFRYSNVFIGLPVVFNIKTDRTHVELAWSPDTKRWYRVSPGTPLIPNSEKRMAYDWGTVYASKPVFTKNEIRLYYGGADGRHGSWNLGYFCLATLRPDGFAGYETTDRERLGTIVTKEVLCTAKTLRVTADVVMSGYVKVTIFDNKNKELAEGELITRTVTDAEVQWKEGFSFGSLKGNEIRLRFELKDAKLYSFSFID